MRLDDSKLPQGIFPVKAEALALILHETSVLALFAAEDCVQYAVEIGKPVCLLSLKPLGIS
jgi:hypothetical protein